MRVIDYEIFSGSCCILINFNLNKSFEISGISVINMTHIKDGTELELPDCNFQIFAWVFVSNVKHFYETRFQIKFPIEWYVSYVKMSYHDGKSKTRRVLHCLSQTGSNPFQCRNHNLLQFGFLDYTLIGFSIP